MRSRWWGSGEKKRACRRKWNQHESKLRKSTLFGRAEGGGRGGQQQSAFPSYPSVGSTASKAETNPHSGGKRQRSDENSNRRGCVVRGVEQKLFLGVALSLYSRSLTHTQRHTNTHTHTRRGISPTPEAVSVVSASLGLTMHRSGVGGGGGSKLILPLLRQSFVYSLF